MKRFPDHPWLHHAGAGCVRPGLHLGIGVGIGRSARAGGSKLARFAGTPILTALSHASGSRQPRCRRGTGRRRQRARDQPRAAGRGAL